MPHLWLGVTIALAVALIATPLAIKVARKLNVVDLPNERKVHEGAIPRMGGVAIYGAFVLGVLALGFYTRAIATFLIACSIIVFIGWLDDYRGLSPMIKLLGQVIASLVLIKGGFYVQFITNPFTDGGLISLGIFAIPVTLLWLTGISNAVNLIDGLDGLSAGVSAIAALTMTIVCYVQGQLQTAALAAVLAAAAFGFLRYNFYPARTFMGDSGSLFLGFSLGALAIMGLSKGATIISIFIPFIIMGIPVFDTFFAIIRRLFLHKPIFQADKGHLHHSLLTLGLSHRQTVLSIYAISAVMGMFAVLIALLTSAQAMIVLIVLTIGIFTGADKLGVLRGNKKGGLLSKKPLGKRQ
ncbi:MAG: undecaprenyl/decaprenyl-phosphate alpha-N-acetylglucosaminyl 1-phosphate transferase [Firmicutes bacterium]|nr:undecaprenyl/decaprenyl-phosphate alpha-N-acetylglucosaminyl 1-phosphate transferase [Bacillota bacterium]